MREFFDTVRGMNFYDDQTTTTGELFERLAGFGLPVLQCRTTDEPVRILCQLFGQKQRARR